MLLVNLSLCVGVCCVEMSATKTPEVNAILNVTCNGKLNFKKCLEQKRLAKGVLSPVRLQSSCAGLPQKCLPSREVQSIDGIGQEAAGYRRGEPSGALELMAPPAACCVPFC